MIISGLSDSVEANTKVDLTCTINRIRPEAAEMFWLINGKKIVGIMDSVQNGDGTTFKHSITLNYT